VTFEWSILEELSAVDAAKRLLGCEFVREFKNGEARVRIVETEAYDQTDAASHSYNGRTQRTDVMFGPAGHLYVYFTYGMHYCMNIVVGPEHYGAAVLIRAIEPINGEDLLAEHRQKSGIELTNGPAKLCQALDIDKRMNGHDLTKEPLKLELMPPLSDVEILVTKRIGITKAIDEPWRFCEKANRYISRLQT
jgi:DNA-3-methyladenine glycosylase